MISLPTQPHPGPRWCDICATRCRGRGGPAQRLKRPGRRSASSPGLTQRECSVLAAMSSGTGVREFLLSEQMGGVFVTVRRAAVRRSTGHTGFRVLMEVGDRLVRPPDPVADESEE